jgi:heptosyltransferase-2
MTSLAIIQPKPGIGDLIWHLPFIRAIAAASPGRKGTLLIPASSHAQELLVAEPAIERTLYFRHHGSELQRGFNLARLTLMLRQLDCDTIWILDRTTRPAFAAMLARIPRRIGYGFGRQRWFITNPGLDRSLDRAEPLEWIKALLAMMDVPCPSTEPSLHLPAEMVVEVGRRYAGRPRPWIVVALGASSPLKDWPLGYWAEFIRALRQRTSGTLFLIGGAPQMERATGLIVQSAGAPSVNACDLAVIEAAALLRQSDLFVGPDSGPMNLAAAVGVPAFGLFGATRVLSHAKFVHVILPDDGGPPRPGGMELISPGQVLDRIASLIGGER